ncbi:Rz1-like lysis system protein LysC [Yersinia bercovieri]|uniref:Rz1-like lysis system protein LysC n=1 Tax=Yersinia bercovieri TaxID=634 RepID=UPI003B96BE5D
MLLLCLLTLSGCTNVPRSPAPTIIYVGCPTVNSCPLPGSSPAVNGDLSADTGMAAGTSTGHHGNRRKTPHRLYS